MPFTLDLSVLATFTLMWLAVVPTPGPNILMVTHVAITRTPVHVAYAIAGNMVGIALLAGLALVGWAAILETFPWLRVGVSVFGGLYLMWLGTRLVRRARRSGCGEAAPSSAGNTASPNLTPPPVIPVLSQFQLFPPSPF